MACEDKQEKDCAGVEGGDAVLDECGICDADTSNDCIQDCAGVWGGNSYLDECDGCDANVNNDCLRICDGLTEVKLWGEWYDIGNTTSIFLQSQGLSGSIPPQIGCLTNLTYLGLFSNQLTGQIPFEIGNLTNLTGLYLHINQLTGEIPQEVCDLIASNNLDMYYILYENNLINTCE